MTRVLIVGPAWVGDMVMAQSLVALLKQREPGAVIDLLAPSWSAPIGSRMPGVERTLTIDIAHRRFDLLKRLRFGRGLRGEGYDRAIVLPNSWKSAIVPWAARIRRRTGYVGEMRYGLLNDARALDRTALVRTVDRFAGLAGEPGEALPAVPFPVLANDRLKGWVVAEKFGLPTDGRIVAFCPGAEFGPARQWPAPHFAALADILFRQGLRTFLIGSRKDAAISETIRDLVAARNKAAVPANLCGVTNLAEAIDLFALTAGIVTNDSGLMHVAAAVGRPVVALYGSTLSAINPPLGQRVAILERTLPCRPCFKRVCPLGHLDCLNLIAASEVAERLEAQLEPVA
jgi:heptosyltransferase-2